MCLFVCGGKVNALFVTNKQNANFFAKKLNKQTNHCMKGSELKEILRKEGVVLMQLADELGMSQQNLSAAFTRDDVKSGLLEKIANAMNKPVGFFYGEGTVQTVTGNNNQVAGNDLTTNDQALIDLLKIKDEQLLLAMKQVSKAQDQMDKVLDNWHNSRG